MKTKLYWVCCGALGLSLTLAGCVRTVNDRTSLGVPLIKDRVEGRYDRSVDEIFTAAKKVVEKMGTLVNEGILYNQTNTVKTVEGRVNQANVWVRVEGIEPKLTLVVVQARTKGGAADVDLAHYIDKEIALNLK
jgi:hypothetical protein